MSDLHPARVLTPAALARFLLLCRKGASRLFDKIKEIVCAALPREQPARDSEAAENQAHSMIRLVARGDSTRELRAHRRLLPARAGGFPLPA